MPVLKLVYSILGCKLTDAGIKAGPCLMLTYRDAMKCHIDRDFRALLDPQAQITSVSEQFTTCHFPVGSRNYSTGSTLVSSTCRYCLMTYTFLVQRDFIAHIPDSAMRRRTKKIPSPLCLEVSRSSPCFQYYVISYDTSKDSSMGFGELAQNANSDVF